VDGDTVFVKTQAAVPPKLEIWNDYGCPAERVSHNDSRWHYTGPWRDTQKGHFASAKDAAAIIRFDGTGVIVTGTYLTNGGKADVYLDGKLDRTVDVYPDEPHNKEGDAVWHAFGLKPGAHTVRLVVRGETYPGSSGSEICIEDLVVFR
jgi:hypothetical protein